MLPPNYTTTTMTSTRRGIGGVGIAEVAPDGAFPARWWMARCQCHGWLRNTPTVPVAASMSPSTARWGDAPASDGHGAGSVSVRWRTRKPAGWTQRSQRERADRRQRR